MKVTKAVRLCGFVLYYQKIFLAAIDATTGPGFARPGFDKAGLRQLTIRNRRDYGLAYRAGGGLSK